MEKSILIFLIAVMGLLSLQEWNRRRWYKPLDVLAIQRYFNKKLAEQKDRIEAEVIRRSQEL